MQPEPDGPQDAVQDPATSIDISARNRTIATTAALSAAGALIVVAVLLLTGVFAGDDELDINDGGFVQEDGLPVDENGALVAHSDSDLTVFLEANVRNDEGKVAAVIDQIHTVDGVDQASWLAPLIVQGIVPDADPVIVEQAVIVVNFDGGLDAAGQKMASKSIGDLDGVVGLAAK